MAVRDVAAITPNFLHATGKVLGPRVPRPRGRGRGTRHVPLGEPGGRRTSSDPRRPLPAAPVQARPRGCPRSPAGRAGPAAATGAAGSGRATPGGPRRRRPAGALLEKIGRSLASVPAPDHIKLLG